MSKEFYYGYPLLDSGGSGNSTSSFVLWQIDPTAPNGKVIAGGTGIVVTVSGGYIVITNSASSSQGGTVSDFSAGNLSPIFSTSVATSTTTPALTFSLTSQSSGLIFAGPSGGVSAPPTFRVVTGNDIASAIRAGSNITIVNGGSALTISGNAGTVTSVGLALPAATYNVAGSPVTSSGTLTGTYVNQPSGAGLFGPQSGASTTPTWRRIAGYDLYDAVEAGPYITLTRTGSTILFTGVPPAAVTSVGLALPADTFNISGSPVTSAGTLTGSFVSQPSGFAHLGPSGGANAAPTWRYITGVDIARALEAGANITLTPTGSTVVIASTASGSGTVTSVADTGLAGLFTSSVSNPTANASISHAFIVQAAITVLAGPTGGSAAAPSFRVLQSQDIYPFLNPGSNVTLTQTGSTLTVAAQGSVSNVSASNITNFATANVSNPTTTPNIAYTLNAQTSGTFLVGPTGGAASVPTFRGIVSQDIYPVFIPGTNMSIVQSGSNITLSAAGSSNVDGTVTSVAVSVPSILSVSGSPVTHAGTIGLTLVGQTSATGFFGPSSGASTPPTFRILTGNDLSPALIAGANIQLSNNGYAITVTSTASGGGGGTVTDFSAGNLSPLFTTSVGTSTTTPALTFTLSTAPSGTAYMGPLSGVNAAPSFRLIQGQDISAIFLPGTNITLTPSGSNITITAAGSSNTNGTVTSVAQTVPASIMSVAGSPITAAGTLAISLTTQTSGTAWMGPASGAAATPTFRNLVGLDLSSIFVNGTNSVVVNNGNTIQINVPNALGGTVTSVALTAPGDTFSVAGSPVTSAGTLAITHVAQPCGVFHAGPSAGVNTAPTWRGITGNDLAPTVVAGTNTTVTNNGTTFQVNAPNALGGTVTSVAQTVPGTLLSIAGSPITNSGTLALSLVTQACNLVFVGPPSGANAAPTFRGVIGNDLALALVAGTNTTVTNNGNTIQVNAPNALGGTVTSVAQTVPGTLLSVAGSPITNSGTLAISLVAQASNLVFVGPPSGANTAPTFRGVIGNDLALALVNGTNTTVVNNGNTIQVNANAGTVTSVALTTPGVIYNVSGSPITSSGTLALTFINQTSGTFLAGPSSGAAGAPTFRIPTGNDLSPALVAGTGITLVNTGSNIVFSSAAAGTLTTFSAGNLSTWFTTNVSNPTTTPALTFSPTGAKGDILYLSNTNTAGNLGIGQATQLLGVVAGLPSYVSTLQGFASAVVTAALTITSKSYQAIDASQGAVTLTLGAASGMPEKIFYFKNITVTGSAAVTVQTNGTDTIEGSLTPKTVFKLQVLGIISDGVSTWRYLEPQIKSPVGGGTGSSTTPTDGQIPIGATSDGVYTPGNIAAGANITITNTAHGITIASTGGGGGASTDVITTQTTSFTASAGYLHKVDTSSASSGLNVTLPNAAGISGQTVKVKISAWGGSPANTLTFLTSAAQTIDGFASGWTPAYRIYDAYIFESDNVNWMLM